MPELTSIPGSCTLLMGAYGSGKTFSLRTLIDAGLNVFTLFVDPGMESVTDRTELHWRYISPAAATWGDLIASAKLINESSNASLQEMTGIHKSSYTQFISVLQQLNNFKAPHESKEYGDVTKWGTDRVLAIDGLTGLGDMSLNLAIGSKPIKTSPDWGVAMDNLHRLIKKLCYDTVCHFVLLAHMEREKDEITGAILKMVSTLGRKLAPVLPIPFSDVILAYREGDKFYWSTKAAETDLKSRHLPLEDKIKPDFGLILKGWKARGGVITPNVENIQPRGEK